MRSSPTSTRTRRTRARPAAGLLLAGTLLAGCEPARIVVETPVPSASAAATQPPLGYNHRYGNNPVAAADAFRLERQLIAAGDLWEVALSTDPAAAGALDHPTTGEVAAARAAARTATLTVATENLTTIRGLLARGRAGQQAYCAGLVDRLRTLGYTGLASARVEVYFTERDRHAELTWTPTGSTYTVFDGDLGGDLNRLPGGTTPFAAPPTP